MKLLMDIWAIQLLLMDFIFWYISVARCHYMTPTHRFPASLCWISIDGPVPLSHSSHVYFLVCLLLSSAPPHWTILFSSQVFSIYFFLYRSWFISSKWNTTAFSLVCSFHDTIWYRTRALRGLIWSMKTKTMGNFDFSWPSPCWSRLKVVNPDHTLAHAS